MSTYYFAIVYNNATDTENNQVVGWSAITPEQGDSGVPVCSTAPGMKAVQLSNMTAADWAELTQGLRGAVALSGGAIVPWTPPPPPLKQQAQAAQQAARQQFTDLQMMGQSFGMKMQAYMRGLAAIINGTDTASTALPTAPADPTQ